MSSSFSKKKIDLEITLKEGKFSDSGSETVRLSGLRVSADIAKTGGIAFNESLIRVWGLTPSMMNQLSTLGLKYSLQGRSAITVFAGDDNSMMSTVFTGDVHEAWAEYQGAPDVPMNLRASTGQLANIKPSPARSFSGGVDVATIMQQLAGSMGLAFENNGVSVMLQSPNFPGTDRAKAFAAAKAARINCMIDDGVLAIWPADGFRGGDIPTLNKDTGMVGYPTYNAMGIAVQCLYNPAIRYGGRVKIESSLPQASKTWYVYQIAHNLESETPGGQWFSSLLLTETAYGYQQ